MITQCLKIEEVPGRIDVGDFGKISSAVESWSVLQSRFLDAGCHVRFRKRVNDVTLIFANFVQNFIFLDEEFEEGDLIWAKLGRDPHWPAVVSLQLHSWETVYFLFNDHDSLNTCHYCYYCCCCFCCCFFYMLDLPKVLKNSFELSSSSYSSTSSSSSTSFSCSSPPPPSYPPSVSLALCLSLTLCLALCLSVGLSFSSLCDKETNQIFWTCCWSC